MDHEDEIIPGPEAARWSGAIPLYSTIFAASSVISVAAWFLLH